MYYEPLKGKIGTVVAINLPIGGGERDHRYQVQFDKSVGIHDGFSQDALDEV